MSSASSSLAAPVDIVVGSHVWVEDPSLAWIDGEVIQTIGQELHVHTPNGNKIVTNVSKVLPMDTEAPPGGVDDMTELLYLHEPGMLQNLKARYDLNEIYTYAGNILVAVNPFQKLPHLYDTHMMEQYKGAGFEELSPHVFAVADVAYRAMISDGKSNSILVSGESGAGKTETTKLLMKYLAHLGSRSGVAGRTIEQQVLESNPVLEAFGNAKTVGNNNSSRFGKYVEIQFDKSGRISGARIRTYLLERSRVCQISNPERNYHCFYLLCAAPPEDREKFKLESPESYHYLNQSNSYDLEGISDAHEYLATRRAMDVVGISEEEQDAIFRVVAAILHLGNVEFARGENINSSVLKDEKSRFHLNVAAGLLKCDAKSLEDALIKHVMVTPSDRITKNLDPKAAVGCRDALAKTMYSHLFDWIVQKINSSIGQDPNSKLLIGVLDIYGFECFKHNSFEQFCINFANEKLQQHFNKSVFEMEQAEYVKEEINWSYIEFVDNQDVLDLIEKDPGGIIALLDEACKFSESTHKGFAQKLYGTFARNKRFTKHKLAHTSFTIHYDAGEVTYLADQFLDKNKDYMAVEHQELLAASECPFVAGLIPRSVESSKLFSSISSDFKHQLQSLIDTLNATQPHYIRCVKPNRFLKPAIFERVNIIKQLHCGGVKEAIRISCAGYPTRRTLDEFALHFHCLCPDVLGGNYDEKVACQMLLDKMGLKGYQIGKTKVFLQAGQMAELDGRRAEVLGNAAKIIQRKFRTYIARKEYILIRKAAIQLQACWRGLSACKQFEQLRTEPAAVCFCRKYLKEADAKNADLMKKLEDAEKRAYEFQEYSKRLEEELSNIESEKADLVKKSKDAEKRVDELQTSSKRLEENLASMMGELEANGPLKRRARPNMKLKKLNLMKKFEEAEERAYQLQESSKRLEEKLSIIEGEKAYLVRESEEKAYLVRESEERAYQLQESSERFEKELSNMMYENAYLMKKFEEVEKRAFQHQEASQRLEEKLANMESENADPKKKLEDAGKRADQLQESSQRLEEKMFNMEFESADIIKKLEDA